MKRRLEIVAHVLLIVLVLSIAVAVSPFSRATAQNISCSDSARCRYSWQCEVSNAFCTSANDCLGCNNDSGLCCFTKVGTCLQGINQMCYSSQCCFADCHDGSGCRR